MLRTLRSLLKERDLAAYIIPSQDAHQSEYVAEKDKRRSFITGFTGSAGTAVVAMEKAWLWTDGRYTLQAQQQLDPNAFTVFRTGPGQQTMESFLGEVLDKGANVGVDPSVFSLRAMRQTKSELEKVGLHLIPVQENLVDIVWDKRPALPRESHIFCQPIGLCGSASIDKLQLVRKEMANSNATTLMLSALDEIAWLFNLRGADISYNPVFFSYALITLNNATLYVDKERMEKEAIDSISEIAEIKPYHTALSDLTQHVACNKDNEVVWLDPTFTSWSVYLAVQGARIIERLSPLALPKAIKNYAELQGLRKCHVRDGVALVRFLHWIETQVQAGHRHTEITASDQLEQYRKEMEMFVGLSFPTISGFGSNGAVIHYRAEPGAEAQLSRDNLYLVDSGAQYRDGTTDVTRTVHWGQPSPQQRRCFTRVLQGHIALANAHFPADTPSSRLDVLARAALWKDGLDYRHGTGHGVGSFLNVHEGPHLISFYARDPDTPLMEGMTVTVEPGYYREGEFGIRIENVTEVVTASAGGSFLTLKALTMAPVQKSLIDVSLLSKEEIEWINNYHESVFTSLAPYLENDTREWLQQQTSPL